MITKVYKKQSGQTTSNLTATGTAFISQLKNNAFEIAQYKEIQFGIQFHIFRNGQDGYLRLFQNKKGRTMIDFTLFDDLSYICQVLGTIKPIAFRLPFKKISVPNRRKRWINKQYKEGNWKWNS
jgi:hypothetical protein